MCIPCSFFDPIHSLVRMALSRPTKLSRFPDSLPPRRSVGLLEQKNCFLLKSVTKIFMWFEAVLFPTSVSCVFSSLVFACAEGIAPRFQSYLWFAILLRMVSFDVKPLWTVRRY